MDQLRAPSSLQPSNVGRCQAMMLSWYSLCSFANMPTPCLHVGASMCVWGVFPMRPSQASGDTLDRQNHIRAEEVPHASAAWRSRRLSMLAAATVCRPSPSGRWPKKIDHVACRVARASQSFGMYVRAARLSSIGFKVGFQPGVQWLPGWLLGFQ